MSIIHFVVAIAFFHALVGYSDDLITLQNATATFSQTAGGYYGADTMIDGVLSDNRGWGIYPEIAAQTAVFETADDVGYAAGTVLTFALVFNVQSVPGTTGHTLGRFRLSVTTDPRSAFADGLQTGGDVAANWSVLSIKSATSEQGSLLTVLPDSSILVSGILKAEDIYTVVAQTRITGITGVRLEALTDPSLPHGGPGREPLNGNFHVAEFVAWARSGGAPTIVAQPVSLTVDSGSSAAFEITASSALALNYQWFFNGSPIEGGTNASLVFPHAQTSNSGEYVVVVSNDDGAVVSDSAILRVRPPRDEVLVRLQNATGTFSQTWDNDYGVNSMIDGVLDDNRGWGIYPNITNQTAVFETAADIGFDRGTLLTFHMLFNVISVPGTTAHTLGRFRLSVTTDPRDTFADGLQTGGDVTANWSVLDIRSAVSYIGATMEELPDHSILVSGALDPEDIYTIVAATPLKNITGIRLEALTDPSLPHWGPGREPLNGNFHVAELALSARPSDSPAIVEQPRSASVTIGDRASFTITATGIPPLDYQWLLNGSKLAGATNASLVIEHVRSGDAGTYTVVVSGPEGITSSEGAVLNVLPTAGGTNAASLFISNLSPLRAPISDSTGALLSGPGYSAQAYVEAGAFLPMGPAVPFLTGTNAGFFSPINLLLPVAPGTRARVQVRVWDNSAGSSYEQALANGGETRTSDVLETATGGGPLPIPQLEGLRSFSLVSPPKIKVQPVSKAALVGDDVTFAIQASGSTGLSYQWRLNSNSIPGATSPSLVLTNVQVDQAGAYDVIVSNPLGSVTSAVANLAVSVPDRTAPLVTITSPAEGTTFNDRVTLTGSIRENVALSSIKWERNGQLGALLLENGNFTVPDLVLTRGTNVLTVRAVDTSGNEGSASVTVLLKASRTLSVGEVLPRQEGARVTVPIVLDSLGDVSGLTFVLNYDRNYLVEPSVEWAGAAAAGLTQVNTNVPGSIRGSFALSGTALAQGQQPIATVTFRSRSVPQTTQTSLPLAVTGVFSPTGDPLTTGTDVISGQAQITRRKYTGDNNANDRLDVADASMIMSYVSQLEFPRPWDTALNDLNRNGQLDTGDVIRVLRAVVGLDLQPGAGNTALTTLSARSVREVNATPTARLLSDKSRLVPGEKVKVTVNLSQFANALSGASFKLQYPIEALRLDDAAAHKTGEIVPSKSLALWNVAPAQNDYSGQNGTISLAVTSDAPWATNNGALAEFNFTVQSGATNQSSWSLSLTALELSSGFDLVPVPSSDLALSSRSPLRPVLGGGFKTNGIFELSFAAEAGARYLIEVSDDLTAWTKLDDAVAADGAVSVADPAAAGKKQRFYRATQVN